MTISWNETAPRAEPLFSRAWYRRKLRKGAELYRERGRAFYLPRFFFDGTALAMRGDGVEIIARLSAAISQQNAWCKAGHWAFNDMRWIGLHATRMAERRMMKQQKRRAA